MLPDSIWFLIGGLLWVAAIVALLAVLSWLGERNAEIDAAFRKAFDWDEDDEEQLQAFARRPHDVDEDEWSA